MVNTLWASGEEQPRRETAMGTLHAIARVRRESGSVDDRYVNVDFWPSTTDRYSDD
jgi:hypothetical protein